jgi:SAM-dependent methyltransferase
MYRFGEAMRRAQEAAFGPGEYVEQQSFVSASEIRGLAEHAGIGHGVSVLDLCCGIAGPGRFLARELGCDYLGVDANATAVDLARERSRGLPCRFEVAEIPPLPPGTFDVILLLETMLAFRHKETLLDEVARALPVGGRFAFTVEEGPPLTEAERAEMPEADTVWLIPLHELHELLARTGLAVRWQEDWSESHRSTAASLADAYAAEGLDELVTSHRLWGDWLAAGRVRKLALVAERRTAAPSQP